MTNPSYGKCYPFDIASGQQADQPEWRRLAGAWGDGIVSDLGGGGSSAFGVTGRSSSTRDFVIKLGEFRIRGIHFEPTQNDLTLTVPTVATNSFRIDRVVARYEPDAKQVSFVVKQGSATTGTPVVPALTRDSGGVWEVGLHRIQGGIGAAGTLTFIDERRWIGPDFYVPSVAALAETDDLPTGARILEANTGCEWRAGHPGGVLELLNLDQPNWTSLLLATLTPAALAGRDGPPQYRVRRGQVEVQGGITIASGNVPAGPTLATLPAGARPAVTKRVLVAASGGWAQVELLPSGVIRLSTLSPACTWFNLDGVAPFQAGN